MSKNPATRHTHIADASKGMELHPQMLSPSLLCMGADEPTNAMMDKIHAELPQGQFTAEESI